MSEIRVDTFKAEDGISAPSFPNGIQVTGVVTATVLDSTVPFLNAGSNIQLGNAGIITATSFTGATGTFSGNVSIGGTLTYEDLTNVDSVGMITARSGVRVPGGDISINSDTGKLYLGAGNDLHIYHAGNHSYIQDNGTGALYIGSNGGGIYVRGQHGEESIIANSHGNVSLYYDNSLKFTTETGGVNITGVCTATSFSGSASGLTGIAAKLSDQRPSMKGLTLTDDGTSSPVLDLKSDDDVPWGLIIGNTTYSSNQRGLKILQENGGQVNTRVSGQGSYINWNFTQDDGSSSRTLMTLGGSGEVVLRYQGNLKMVTTSTGISVTGTVSDSKGDLRKIIHKQESSAYTLVAADAGKAIEIASGGITVPSSVFGAGDAVTIINDSSSSQTITKGSGLNMFNSADATNANRTLGGRGMATIYFVNSSTSYISGAGLS